MYLYAYISTGENMSKDEALKLAMDFVASISPAFICEATHHKKNERHADNEPCPHVKKQKQTYEAIKKALANEALEKKAENARELGLNYEPEPWSNVGIGVDVTKEGVSVVGIYKLSNDSSHLFYSQFYATPPQRKPLTGQMTKQMRESCDSYEMRGAFVDGWLSAEAAHGIKGEV